jgi:hypothetical protein
LISLSLRNIPREQCLSFCSLHKACFPLGEFVRANRERSDLIGWLQTLTSSPANHIHVLLIGAKKIAKWKTGFRHDEERVFYFQMQ